MRIKKKYLQEKTVGEVEEKTVTQKIYSREEVKKAEKEGIGIPVDGTVVPTEDGGLEVTTKKNESTFTMTKGELIESLNIKRGRKVIKTIKVKDIKND
jgi:prolyl-tRNA synthetase